MRYERQPLWLFKIGDFVRDAAGEKFEIIAFGRLEVTLVDAKGERSYAHPLHPMEPWFADDAPAEEPHEPSL